MTSGYEEVIEARRGFFDVDWKGVVRYRQLLGILIGREVSIKYQRLFLGFLWVILQPILSVYVFVLVFSRWIGVPTAGTSAVLFYLSGLLVWNHFAGCFQGSARTFRANQELFSKIYFPRIFLPLSNTLFNLIAFGAQLALFLVVYLVLKDSSAQGPMIRPNGFLWMLPVVVGVTSLLGMGAGLWLAAISTRVRDAQNLVGFLTQCWFFLSPVVYSDFQLPEPWRWVMALNPMTLMIGTVRHGFLGTGSFEAWHFLVSVFSTVAVFVTGVLLFIHSESRFAETL